MHTLSKIVFLFFACCAIAYAQTQTVVSANISDPTGIPYANGSVSIQLLVPGGQSPTVNGKPISGTLGPIGLDSNGHFSVSLFCNSAGGGCSPISPSGTQWQFTVSNPGASPPLGVGNVTFTLPITITGATQDLSHTLNVVAPILFASNGFSVSIVQLTPAQIKAIVTTPVVLVKGRPGKVIVPEEWVTLYKFGTVPYTVPLGATLNISYSNTDLYNVGLSMAGIIDQSSNQQGVIISWNFSSAGDDETGLDFVLLGQVGNPTAGDGTLTIVLYYRSITIP